MSDHDKVKAVTDILDSGVKELFESERYKEYLTLTCQEVVYSAEDMRGKAKGEAFASPLGYLSGGFGVLSESGDVVAAAIASLSLTVVGLIASATSQTSGTCCALKLTVDITTFFSISSTK